jgi:hypothetical protein
VGRYELCSVPADSAMVWLALRDGRRFGVPVRTDPERPATASFRPDPQEQLRGTLLYVQARMPSGAAVQKAQVVVVGRKLAEGAEPTMVYMREAVTDGGGLAGFRLPYGTYEILVMNPRQGEHGRAEQFVVAHGAPAEVVHEVVLRGTSTEGERTRWRQDLLARAEQFQRLWGEYAAGH